MRVFCVSRRSLPAGWQDVGQGVQGLLRRVHVHELCQRIPEVHSAERQGLLHTSVCLVLVPCVSCFVLRCAAHCQDDALPVGGRVPICLHLCLLPLVACALDLSALCAEPLCILCPAVCL